MVITWAKIEIKSKDILYYWWGLRKNCCLSSPKQTLLINHLYSPPDAISIQRSRKSQPINHIYGKVRKTLCQFNYVNKELEISLKYQIETPVLLQKQCHLKRETMRNSTYFNGKLEDGNYHFIIWPQRNKENKPEAGKMKRSWMSLILYSLIESVTRSFKIGSETWCYKHLNF